MEVYTDNLLDNIIKNKPILWENKTKRKFNEVIDKLGLKYSNILDAAERLERFAPLIKRLFPETENGIIESPLVKSLGLKAQLENEYNKVINGQVYLKCDSHLKVAGSIKARGGIYEVLKYAEKIAVENNLLKIGDDYLKLVDEDFRELFSKYKIVVGSTGNLGMSIGIMSSALGFSVTVHMSRDAKEWKKKILREKGVNVVEHDKDYTKAVEEGRRQCKGDKRAHFVDDENSKDLFLGYSVAAIRLNEQLKKEKIVVDSKHPLYVYLPCGVGGAPGGIAFGLKHLFGDNVYCYFVEPTHAPCMILGILTGKFEKVNVKDYGIDGITEADGLAVGSPSKLVSRMVGNLVDGIYTIDDSELFKLLTLVKDTENIKIEPSAAASVLGPVMVDVEEKATHILWLTGGSFLPEDVYWDMYNRGIKMRGQ